MKSHCLFLHAARLLTMGVLLTCAVPVSAVVQNVTVVKPDGQPLRNTTVTIVFPNGDTEQKETDDRGVLIFDFPGSGTYAIRFPGGQMTHTVTGAGGGNQGKWLAGTAAVFGTTAALIISNDDGSNDSTSSGDSPGGGNPPGGTSIDGTYNCSFSATSNADMHPTGSLNGSYGVTTSGSNGTLTHSSGGTSFTASGAASASSLNYSGSGSFEARTGAMVSGTLSFSGNNATGNLTLTCSACPDTNGNSTADPVTGNLSCTRV